MDRSAPADVIGDLAHGHIAARCLQVVADFGVADALDDEPAPAAVLAQRTGLDADALNRMLRLLAMHGVFAQQGGGYVHTPASRLLRSDHPQSLRSFPRMHGLAPMWGGFTRLAHAARTGRPAADWSAMVRHLEAHPDDGAVFNDAMVGKSRRVIPAVVEAYDWSGGARIADVGGGRGHLLGAILERAPAATGVLFELPQVIAEVRHLESQRLALAAGDLFADALPAADVYLLMDLLHDWGDGDAARILAAVRRAAPGARALIVETLISEEPGWQFGKVLDVIMLAVTGGRERTAAEHEALLAAAGFRLERVIPTRSPYTIVEAVAA